MLEPPAPLTPKQERALLEPLAARLIWWQPAEDSLRHPDRVIAQVMDIGEYDAVLRKAQAGWFSPRSWNHWHRKLAVTPSGPVPPLAEAIGHLPHAVAGALQGRQGAVLGEAADGAGGLAPECPGGGHDVARAKEPLHPPARDGPALGESIGDEEAIREVQG